MAVRGELTQQRGRSPRPRELAEHLGVDLDDVIEALATDGCFPGLAGPTGRRRPSPTLGETLDEEADDLAAADARLTLAPLIRRLCERDRRILDLRFFHDATQQEIADDIGVTQMHVSRLLTRILSHLHDSLEEPVELSSEGIRPQPRRHRHRCRSGPRGDASKGVLVAMGERCTIPRKPGSDRVPVPGGADQPGTTE